MPKPSSRMRRGSIQAACADSWKRSSPASTATRAPSGACSPWAAGRAPIRSPCPSMAPMRLRDFYERKDVALRLAPRFDAARLADDLARMDEAWWDAHLSDYHDGNWQTISLHAPGGARGNQTSRGGAFAPTDALARCAYVGDVMRSLPGEKNRVRFLRLRPGGEIYPHSDPMHRIDPSLVRLHVPVTTNPAVDFRVNGVALTMAPGEVWYVDVRFRHSVKNGGET